jgi:hypothetical protein
MAAYIHTSPVSDWFFVNNNPLSVSRLALWATREDGTITGLIPVSASYDASRSMSRTTASLVEPPPVEGHYKHFLSLTPEEKKLAEKF